MLAFKRKLGKWLPVLVRRNALVRPAGAIQVVAHPAQPDQVPESGGNVGFQWDTISMDKFSESDGSPWEQATGPGPDSATASTRHPPQCSPSGSQNSIRVSFSSCFQYIFHFQSQRSLFPHFTAQPTIPDFLRLFIPVVVLVLSLFYKYDRCWRGQKSQALYLLLYTGLCRNGRQGVKVSMFLNYWIDFVRLISESLFQCDCFLVATTTGFELQLEMSPFKLKPTSFASIRL